MEKYIQTQKMKIDNIQKLKASLSNEATMSVQEDALPHHKYRIKENPHLNLFLC